MPAPKLKDLLQSTSHSHLSKRVALKDTSGKEISYSEYYLESVSTGSKLRDICPSATHICILSEKSIASLILIQAVLQIDACYIPLNPSIPFAKNLSFVDSSDFDMLIVSDKLTPDAVKQDQSAYHIRIRDHSFYIILKKGKGKSEPKTDLAYMLFTSGSTGTPKGVMMTHSSVMYFLNWCSSVFQPHPDHVFSSIAPWCFDLTILDIFLPIKHGSTLVVFTENETQNPRLLASLISELRITHLYATPTLLRSLISFGNLKMYDHKTLKAVLFAGEVFPIKPLNALRKIWNQASFFNLYGPTETNVCTYFKLPDTIDKARESPYPIGKPCEGTEYKIKDNSPEGTLLISGPGVMRGYYHNLAATEQKMNKDNDGKIWYDTGDLVTCDENGDLHFAGRADRQIKRKGYRIELEEIEAAIANHEAVIECAVVAGTKGDDMIITAFFAATDQLSLSIAQLREYLVETLENYKMPDKFVICDSLPKTISGKIDHAQLKNT